MDWSFGHDSAWWTSLGTWAMAVFSMGTVVIAYRTYRAQKREQREAQAWKVYLDSGPRGTTSALVDGEQSRVHFYDPSLVNGSGGPIHRVRIGHWDFSEQHLDGSSVRVLFETVEAKGHAKLLGGSRIFLVPGDDARQRIDNAELSVIFDDAQGRTWERTLSNELRPAKADAYLPSRRI